MNPQAAAFATIHWIHQHHGSPWVHMYFHRASGGISKFPRLAPLRGPASADLVVLRPAGSSRKIAILGDLRQPPGTLGRLLGDHLVSPSLARGTTGK